MIGTKRELFSASCFNFFTILVKKNLYLANPLTYKNAMWKYSSTLCSMQSKFDEDTAFSIPCLQQLPTLHRMHFDRQLCSAQLTKPGVATTPTFFQGDFLACDKINHARLQAVSFRTNTGVEPTIVLRRTPGFYFCCLGLTTNKRIKWLFENNNGSSSRD